MNDFSLLEEWVKERLPWVRQEQVEQLRSYAALLYSWSGRMNLIAPGDREWLATRHLVPALKMGAVIMGLPHRRIMDFGSGGGLPGVPLKIMLKDAEVLLVEGRRKRANFLREVVRRVELDNTLVLDERIEAIAPREEKRVDVVVSRAVAEPGKLLELVHPYLKPYGVVVTALGPKGKKGPFMAKVEDTWRGGRSRIGVLR